MSENDAKLIDLTQANTESQSLTQTQSGSLQLTPFSQHSEPIDPWGCLNVYDISPKRLGSRLVNYLFKKIGTIDLTKEQTSIGRGKADFRVENLKNDDRFEEVSAVHFSIIKNVIDDPYSPVFLEDSSTNGTFIEKRECSVKKRERLSLKSDRLDKRLRRCILAHKDVIFIQKRPTIAYEYECYQIIENDLPPEINKIYHVGRELGSGAGGTVYFVQDRQKLTPYALKITQGDENKIHKLYKEVELLRTLQHPCILKFVAVKPYDSSLSICLEFMAGGDLLARIRKFVDKKEYMCESLAKFIFYQICAGVKYLHDERVTHRDLKPENILLATNDDYTLVKISDFGLSKRIRNTTQLNTQCGTLMYLAPEVQHTRNYTNKVDIWSLGVVLYNCLSGRYPFTMESYTQNPGVIHFNCPVWRSISNDAISIIRDALQVNGNERPSIEEILKRKWLTINDQYIQMARDRIGM